MGSIEINNSARQEIVLTLALKEALSILTMPLPELAMWLQEQIERNPALQFENAPSTRGAGDWIEQLPAQGPGFHEHLLAQAREVLTTKADLKGMEELIGNLDERGFCLSGDARLLKVLQTFDPPGVGADSLQHALLLQLERRGERETLAYRLVKECYNDLLRNQRETICDKLSCSRETLDETLITTLSTLTLNPRALFDTAATPVHLPDIFVESADNGWVISLNDALLPKFHVNLESQLSSRFTAAAEWIQKMVTKRGEMMVKVAEVVLAIQADFFHGKTADLKPLTVRYVARKTGLHESTVSRVVKDKYLASPRGVFPLRFFFSQKAASDEVSCYTAKEKLKVLVQKEARESPLTDEALAKALAEQGVPCARRTVAKYRKSLGIPSAARRNTLSI